jgi:cell division protein FtsN
MKIRMAIAFLILLACACAPKPATQEPTAAEVVPLYEREEPEAEAFPEAVGGEPVAPTEPAAMASGFRVQIGAFERQDGAEQRAAQARFQFTESVYVEYVYPYYKVRVGDCSTRAEAERLRQKAISLGYSDAFLVPTTITTK